MTVGDPKNNQTKQSVGHDTPVGDFAAGPVFVS